MRNETTPTWTEGVCGDGAAILRDGIPVSISDLLATLNYYEGGGRPLPSEKEVDRMFFAHGGRFHGPRVETATIPQTNFYRFMEAVILATQRPQPMPGDSQTTTKLEKFARDCGVHLIPCDPEWGGRIGYNTDDSPNCSINGFRSNSAALRHWMDSTFGERAGRAVRGLLAGKR